MTGGLRRERRPCKSEQRHDVGDGAGGIHRQRDAEGKRGRCHPAFWFQQAKLTAQLAKGRFLSKTGRCHAFSAEADGYARRAGGAFLLLQREGAAGFAPRALVVGSGVSQNRAQKPISAVDGDAQERAIRLALADAGLDDAGDVKAVECHGTGTPLGDPVEAAALQRVYPAAALAAAKGRFGHLESAAG